MKHLNFCDYGMNTTGNLDTMVAMIIRNDIMNDLIMGRFKIKRTTVHPSQRSASLEQNDVQKCHKKMDGSAIVLKTKVFL
jgi:hypothetical protein